MDKPQYETRPNNRRSRNQRRRAARIGGGILFLSCLTVLVLLLFHPFDGASKENFGQNHPAQSTASLSTKNSNGIAGESSTNRAAWNLILVKKGHSIPDGYQVERMQLSNGQSVDTRIYPALQQMFDAARADGIYPVVASGYRTLQEQQGLMDEKIVEYKSKGYSLAEAKREAEAWVAVPGTSEHQLGLAMDINADGIHSAGHEVYDWLDKNAWQYGFIRRYPPDKTKITSVANEPWHYRYVGVEAAEKIQKQGICLEEYLDMLNDERAQ